MSAPAKLVREALRERLQSRPAKLVREALRERLQSRPAKLVREALRERLQSRPAKLVREALRERLQSRPAKLVREALRERLQSRPVIVEAKTLRIGQAVRYIRLTGGDYFGFVTRIFPRRGEVRVVMWSKTVKHHDGTYGPKNGGVALRTDLIHESQIREALP
jgi:hypothetical protein